MTYDDGRRRRNGPSARAAPPPAASSRSRAKRASGASPTIDVARRRARSRNEAAHASRWGSTSSVLILLFVVRSQFSDRLAERCVSGSTTRRPIADNRARRRRDAARRSQGQGRRRRGGRQGRRHGQRRRRQKTRDTPTKHEGDHDEARRRGHRPVAQDRAGRHRRARRRHARCASVPGRPERAHRPDAREATAAASASSAMDGSPLGWSGALVRYGLLVLAANLVLLLLPIARLIGLRARGLFFGARLDAQPEPAGLPGPLAKTLVVDA